mgnify:FL=1
MANWRMDFIDKLPAIKPSLKTWIATDIGRFRKLVDGKVWTIEELLTDNALLIEGRTMQHCVATYIHRCARRKTSIWSMKVKDGERKKRALTIEVLPYTKTIVQAKGRRNAVPCDFAKVMLRQWAAQEGLKITETI